LLCDNLVVKVIQQASCSLIVHFLILILVIIIFLFLLFP